VFARVEARMPKLTLILVVGIFVGLVFVLAVQVLTHC